MAFCVRLARSLVYLLETKNKDGYVFRTDLRLRPHLPGHPLALSSEDAELYYERHGQNWERAALIKARTVAGDEVAGAAFLKALVPFIWRKHLDYAAIRDIHSIKRQINAYRGFGTIRVLGHDLKVGRGGIREIEFFAQTQQLILGGREPGLRLPQTCAALAALAERRWVEPDVAVELTHAYRVLRELEHRLQMVADRQTQALPDREADFEKFAGFAGFASAAELEGAGAGHAADRGAPLRRAVRARARPRRRLDPGLHRHRRRPGDAQDTGRHGVQGALGDLGTHPRLASRPYPRHAQHPGARAADRAHARPADLPAEPARPRCRLPPVRRVPDRPAVRRAAVLAAAGQPRAPQPSGRRDGRGTAARPSPEPQRRPVRRHAHAGLLRAPAGPGSAGGRAGNTPARFPRSRGHARHLPALGPRAAVPGRPPDPVGHRAGGGRGQDPGRHRRGGDHLPAARSPASHGSTARRDPGRRVRRPGPGQAGRARADGGLGPGPRLRLRGAGGCPFRRVAAPAGRHLLCAARAAPGEQPLRQDRRGHALRDRHAATAVRQRRARSPPRSPTSPSTMPRPPSRGSCRP